SSEDPVRVFQQFATIDLISDGRAEIMAGRGSFIESFPLFGYELEDYEELFVEKLDLLLNIRDNVKVHWNKGRHRAPINGLGIYPRPLQEKLPVWIAIGGTPQSVVRAGTLGLPLAIAILGGDPIRFSPLVELHRKVSMEQGHGILPVGINIHGFIAETSQKARDLFWPGHNRAMNQIGRERGWAPQTRDHFEYECGPTGAIGVGSPQEVTEKIIRMHETMKMDRFMMQLSIGYLPHKEIMKAIELYGNVVAPKVREHVGVKASV
ncbi:MAG: LLM class flavin-dependent oxidoreductase, partial [Candidatus Nanopelagicales bacterium]